MSEPRPAGAQRASLWMIWGSCLFAPVCYVAVGWRLLGGEVALPYPQPLTSLLILFAVASVAVGLVLPDRVLRSLWRPQIDEAAALAAYQTAAIVRWAAFEVVAVCGFVLLVVSHQALPAVAGATIAIALIVGSRPAPVEALRRLRLP